MADFYDKVQEILASSSKEEATALLFGSKSTMGRQELLEAIIAKFTRKKERIITKENVPNINGRMEEKIIFDLAKSSSNLFEMVFISSYIQLGWQKEVARLKKEKSKEKDPQRQRAIQDRINDINNNIIRPLTSNSQINRTQILNGNNVNETDMKQLQQSVLLIQVLRDSLQHKSASTTVGENVNVVNHMGKIKFETSIPIKYLEGFATNNLITLPEDKDVVEKTNDIVSPILEAIDYDPSKLESFFYNVSPNQMSFLLDKCNNSMEDIYRLPLWCFDEKLNPIIEYVSKGGPLTQGDINLIKKIHLKSDNDPSSVITILERFNKTKILNDNTARFIEMLTPNMFKDPTGSIKLYFFLAGEKEQLSEQDFKMLDAIRKNSTLQFTNPIDNIKNNIRNSYIIADYLRKYNQNNGEFRDCDIELMSKIKDIGEFDLDYLNKILNAIDVHRRDGPELTPNAIELIANLSYSVFSIEIKKEINKIKKSLEEIDPYTPEKLPIVPPLAKETKPANFEGVKYNLVNYIDLLYKEGKIVDDNTIKELVLRSYIFGDRELIYGVLTLSEYLLKGEKRPFTKAEKTLLSGISMEQYKKLVILGPGISDKLYEEQLNSTSVNIPIGKKRTSLLDTLDYVRDDGPLTIEQAYAVIYSQNTKEFSDDMKTLMSNAYSAGKKAYVSIINTICGYGLENDDIPNLDTLLKKVDGDYTRLKEFPKEMFTVTKEVLDQMLTSYDFNMCRSIFGTDNPKLMVAMIYANSVFSRCDPSVRSKLDIDVADIALSCAKNTTEMAYVNGIPMDIYTTYGKQFEPTRNDPNLSRDEQYVEHFITKLRNASAHFRMSPVYGNDLQILDDKILIYDSGDTGRNFSLIMDIDQFVEITRQVEIATKTNTISTGPVESNPTGKNK